MYETALLESKDPTLLLQTCHQINDEALPVLYQRDVSFSSQAAFTAWIERSTPSNLARVRTLHLHLTDIDLAPLVDPRALINPSRRITIWTFCEGVLDQLRDGLRVLPNLTHLGITPPDRGSPAFWQILYRPLLASIPTLCPQLKQLDVYDSDELMTTVPALQQVATVKFTKDTTLPETVESADEGRKNVRAAAAVGYEVLSGLLQEGRRAASAPAVSRPPSIRRRSSNSVAIKSEWD